ncbi:MAG TPA: transcription elongation factor GreA [Chloroflexota bacterium]|nr:transcription elongation factor GreA [Chloroflexota bacterium]
MSSSQPPGAPSGMQLGQAVSTYLGTLPAAEREAQAPMLLRFSRWLGPDRDLNAIMPIELERYQEQLGEVGIDPTRSLDGLKNFLADAKKRGWTDTNLGLHVKVRRKPAATRATANNNTATAEARVEMTQEGLAALQQELYRLEHEVRPRVTATMQRAAADKDFRENAPYHAAKEELSAVQSRINALRDTISAAAIVERSAADRAGLGTCVVVRDLVEDEEFRYTLVGPGEIDPRRGKISIQSPVAQALVDHAAGDVVEVETPAGIVHYRIERIEPAK